MPYSLKLLLISLVTVPATITVVLLAAFDRNGRLAYRLTQLWAGTILKISGIHVSVQGRNGLSADRPYIFMVNHESNIDIPVLVQALPQFQLRWIAKRELLWVPFFGWALWGSKHIIVDRSNFGEAVATLGKAREKIAAGISVVIFPEGTRSMKGLLLPFKRGGFALAVKTKTPIVPVTVKGSGAILPKGDWRIRKGEIEVIVSEPIPTDQCRLGDLPQLLGCVRDIMESRSRPSQPAPDDDSPNSLRAVVNT
jgi:1-acyl-sn-glycerol-3-phosphate acyltransferase